MNPGKALTKKGDFLQDIEEIRRRARQHIEQGAVTAGYKGNRETVLRVLNEALATELVCVLRYKRHHFMAKGIHSQAVAEEFLEHAREEQGHADQIAERIMQLDGEPNFSPEGMLTRSHSEYVEGKTLVDMIQEGRPRFSIFLERRPGERQQRWGSHPGRRFSCGG